MHLQNYLSFWGRNGFYGKNQGVDIWEGARLVGALKTKQINIKNKTNKKTCGSQ